MYGQFANRPDNFIPETVAEDHKEHRAKEGKTFGRGKEKTSGEEIKFLPPSHPSTTPVS